MSGMSMPPTKPTVPVREVFRGNHPNQVRPFVFLEEQTRHVRHRRLAVVA
jgi:hypothetical protein